MNMADEHFSHEVIARFFRSELSRRETRDLVRHLLRQCPRCSQLLRAAVQGQDFRLLVGGVDKAASHFAPGIQQRILERILYLVKPKEDRPARGSARGRA
jgi:hypothetical protein